jgi:UTP--glucose-1-phosphate uridylyltransferase
LDWTGIEREIAGILEGIDGLAVDRTLVERFATDILAGRLSRGANRVAGAPEPPRSDEIDDVSSMPEKTRNEYAALGRESIARGEVAVAVLNGGMATRFGGVVKGIVEATDDESFLEIKRRQARRHGEVPLLVMNSFATHRATLDYLEERSLTEGVRTFVQSVSLRLTPKGELFRDARRRVSPYAPGHGDFPTALRTSGLYSELRERGVRTVLLSNVDNLGADLDPTLLGHHLSHGRGVTVEVAPSVPHDAGGGPARLDGRLQIVESFRLPEGFDLESLPFVNTNTLWFSLETLEQDYPLTWFYVEKDVEGEVAVQVEHLIGQITAFVESRYLLVPREGPDFRYSPVKSPKDLEALRHDPERVARVRASIRRL